MAERLPAKRYVTRLLLTVAWLVLIDQFVPIVLRRVEHQRYETPTSFRFGNSDLFGLRPLVLYLREHPRGVRRRVVFFGNSMTFGYLLSTERALPARFEQMHPDTRVFNAAINGQELGTSYLIAKSIFGSIDELYVQVVGTKANGFLPALLPLDAEDVRAFGLQPANPVELRLRSWLGKVWRLYAVNDRLQAALFGISTRQYLYMNKRELAMRVLRPGYAPSRATDDTIVRPAARVELRAPRAAQKPNSAELAAVCAEEWDVLCRFARLAQAERKRVTFLMYEYGAARDASRVERFNAAFAPYSEIAMVYVPRELTLDGQHLNPAGAIAVAEALTQHERERGALPR